jgi:hypothetical protein
MHGAQDYLAGLCHLHELATDEERRAAWRQGLTALAVAADQHPTPLEGLDVQRLLASAHLALASGLVDDVAWLSRPAAATALFELAAALPQGREKREIGRRVLTALHEGDAPTFVCLARALALGSRRALSGSAVRARVALAMQLPIGADAGVDALALALLLRSDLERDWLSGPSTETLPVRRLAARLVERAAREVTRRAAAGDDTAARVFTRPSVRAAWARLLADREWPVWRHVATARGLLLPVLPELAEEIDRSLLPRQGPAEWRRAATSLSASMGHAPDAALARCRDLATGPIVKRDPAVRIALMYGLSGACVEEPEAAATLLQLLVYSGDLDVLEAVAELRRDHVLGDFSALARTAALARLRALPPSPDDGVTALREAIEEELSPAPGTRSLGQELSAALQAFADGRPLRPHTEAALEAARRLVADLEAAGDDSAHERRRAFRALRELDAHLLETSALADLVRVSGLDLGLGAQSGSHDLSTRLHDWLCKREEAPLTRAEIPSLTLRLRRLRALLHVLDAQESAATEELAAAVRERRLHAFRLLLRRVELDAPSPLRRITCAALARACDRLVRDDVCELSDVLVALVTRVRGAEDLRALSEASMLPDLKGALRAAAEVASAASAPPAGPTPPPSATTLLDTFRALAHAMPPGASPRVEALRRAFGTLARALRGVQAARSLAALKPGQQGALLERLSDAAQYAARLSGAAQRRMGLGGAADKPSLRRALRKLELAIDRAGADSVSPMVDALRAVSTAARADLPGLVAEVMSRVLARVATLPQDSDGLQETGAGAVLAGGAPEHRQPLPAWLPPSRIMGGFHIVRVIGSGSGGSVFVARRAEERHDEGAETYALKVPSYDGQNAHTLSEQEFLKLFREEAGALLTLPAHPNLAGFVTFDARARPKPILVMELVHGPTLERLLDKRELSISVAFSVLDGVAAGLGAMHAAGIGHLDVKPGNVILRVPPAGFAGSRLIALSSLSPTPVLVDFGLAGRHIRPGCASPLYGAPEVWDTPARAASDPTAADVYSFCCMAYELLTGRSLFTADTLPGVIASHLGHDGNPAGLARLRADARMAPLAELLTAGLQPDARHRASMADIAAAMREIAGHLEDTSWPLAA